MKRRVTQQGIKNGIILMRVSVGACIQRNAAEGMLKNLLGAACHRLVFLCVFFLIQLMLRSGVNLR